MRESVYDEGDVEVETWPKYKGHPRSRWSLANRIELVRAARPTFGPGECAEMQRTLAVLLGDMADTDPAPALLSRRIGARRAKPGFHARPRP